jgi:hypothetical protein
MQVLCPCQPVLQATETGKVSVSRKKSTRNMGERGIILRLFRRLKVAV